MRKLIVTLLGSAFLLGCNADGNKTNIELVQDMMDQISLKAQDWDPLRDGQAGQMVPPENTVPRNFEPSEYDGDYMAMQTKLKNPMSGDFSPQIIELGKAKYDIYCAVCHGATGEGNGKVGTYMPVRPRNLISDEAKAYSDGRLFGAISMGFGTMGAYSSQIYKKEDRWALVNYVRTLQKVGGK